MNPLSVSQRGNTTASTTGKSVENVLFSSSIFRLHEPFTKFLETEEANPSPNMRAVDWVWPFSRLSEFLVSRKDFNFAWAAKRGPGFVA